MSLDSPYRMGKYVVTSLKWPSTSATSHHLRHLRNLTAGNGLHHLAHLIELFYEAIHLLYVSSTAFRNSLTARGVQYFWMCALLRSHRVDNGFNALEGIIVNVDIFNVLIRINKLKYVVQSVIKNKTYSDR